MSGKEVRIKLFTFSPNLQSRVRMDYMQAALGGFLGKAELRFEQDSSGTYVVLPPHVAKDHNRNNALPVGMIGLHTTANGIYGTVASTIKDHVCGRKWPKVAYHFIVDRDGTIWYLTPVPDDGMLTRITSGFGVSPYVDQFPSGAQAFWGGPPNTRVISLTWNGGTCMPFSTKKNSNFPTYIARNEQEIREAISRGYTDVEHLYEPTCQNMTEIQKQVYFAVLRELLEKFIRITPDLKIVGHYRFMYDKQLRFIPNDNYRSDLWSKTCPNFLVKKFLRENGLGQYENRDLGLSPAFREINKGRRHQKNNDAFKDLYDGEERIFDYISENGVHYCLRFRTEKEREEILRRKRRS